MSMSSTKRTPFDMPCRSVECYQHLNFIEEGAYGLVFRACEKATGRIYALKQVKFSSEKDGFPVTALREITTLFSVSHENVINLREVVIGNRIDKVYLVMDYAEHDLHNLIDRMERPYSPSEIKSLLQQLLRGVEHLHDRWILHRDLKPSNLLLTCEGVLKICDFGLARYYSDPLSEYTHGVVTLWYRAPELLFGSEKYSNAIDMWSVGCIFAELLLMHPLFNGEGELEQLSKITAVLGAPCEERWKGFSDLPNAKRLSFRKAGTQNRMRLTLLAAASTSSATRPPESAVDLIEKMLVYDPEERISAKDALKHAYFSEMPLPKDPALIQTFPDDRRGG